MSRYFEALERGDLQAAYERTQLGELSRASSPGASLTFEHYEAFYRANPLRRYQIGAVTRQDIRTDINEPGEAFYEVQASLTYPDGAHAEVFTVKAPGIVQIEPARVLAQLPRGVLKVDGIATGKAMAAGRRIILLLNGVHTLRVGGGAVRIRTDPLTVIEGTGHVAGGVLIIG